MVATLVFSMAMAAAQAETKIELAPELRTFPELAQALSAPGRRVTASSALARRISMVSLRNRTWAEARPLLEKGLDVTIHSSAEGNWSIEESAEAEVRNAKLYNAFLGESEALYGRIFDQFRKISKNQVPPDLKMVNALIDEQIRVAPPAPGTREGHRLFGSTGPWERLAALALLFGTASSSVPDFKLSGPGLYRVMKGNSLKNLVTGDVVDRGDAYFWRDWRDLPEWVRYRAVAHVRSLEEQLAKQDLPPAEKQRQLDEKARDTAIAHRLNFDPIFGKVSFEFSVLSDPTTGPNSTLSSIPSEPLVFTVKDAYQNADVKEITVTAVARESQEISKQLFTTSFITVAGSDQWYDEAEIRAFALPMNATFLRQLAGQAEAEKDLVARIQETDRILADPRAERNFRILARNTSLGQTMAAFAKETGTEVVMEVQPSRDLRLGFGTNNPQLRSAAAWLTEGKQDTQGQVPAWTACLDRNVLIVRDEWAFLDRKYSIFPQAALQLARMTRETEAGSVLRYTDFAKYCQTTQPSVNAEIARVHPAFAVPNAAQVYPFVQLLEKLPPKMREELFGWVRTNRPYELPLSGIALQTRLGLAAELRRVCEADRRANRVGGAYHHSVFHPNFGNFLAKATLTVTPTEALVNGEKFYRLSFSLGTNPATAPKSNPKEGRHLIFRTARASFYSETSPLFELP